MARVTYGNEEAFDVMAFGRPDLSTVQFLSAYNDNVSRNYTQQAAAFVSALNPIFNFVDFDRLNNLAYQLNNKVSNLIETNVVLPLFTLEELQQANLYNRRFIMACPDIREMYHNNQCHGYGDGYIDAEPNAIGMGHYDYRRATDQLMIMTEDGWSATTYFDDIHSGDRPLVLGEKEDIQLMWEAAKSFIKNKRKDPTSQNDDPL